MHHRKFLLAAAFLALGAAAAPETPLATLRDGLRANTDAFARASTRPNWSPTVRDITNCALTRLALGDDPRFAEQMLRHALDAQDMDPQSPTYGAIPWQINHPEIQDANSIEFAMQAIGPLLKHYGSRLSPEFRKELERHAQAGFACMRRHKVPVSYTNIFLMKTVNLILMGEAVRDDEAAAEGYRQLSDWLDYTRQAGIHEFASPTYYSTDLGSLLMGYLYAARPGSRETFGRILDYFWTDIAANYFAPRRDLGGAHSRDYDFLGGDGGLLLNMALGGLRDSYTTTKPDFEKVFPLESGLNHGYMPPESILKIAREPERIIEAKWDSAPGKDRYHYITPEFSIGSASASYGPQDKLIAVELASAKELPVITVVPDLFDAPYGKLKSKDRSGHSKPTHIPLHPNLVQRKGAILALLDLDPSREKPTVSLATNIVLPAAADSITLDDAVVDASKPFERPAGAKSVVTIREGRAAVAVRIFEAAACDGQKPAFVLKADPEGLKWGALRYAVYQYRGAEKQLTEKHLRVGILIAAGSDATELTERLRAAKIETTSDGVRARVGSEVFEAGREKREGSVFSINGRPVKLE
jgi:hypothetical protein